MLESNICSLPAANELFEFDDADFWQLDAWRTKYRESTRKVEFGDRFVAFLVCAAADKADAFSISTPEKFLDVIGPSR